jgi:hypothetical protein
MLAAAILPLGSTCDNDSFTGLVQLWREIGLRARIRRMRTSCELSIGDPTKHAIQVKQTTQNGNGALVPAGENVWVRFPLLRRHYGRIAEWQRSRTTRSGENWVTLEKA